MKNRLIRMTFLTSIFALMLITLYSPLSQITIAAYSVTIMHLFVLIGIYVFDDWKESLALGLFFGIISMMYAFQFPLPQKLPFQNPLISILPRVLFSMSAFGLLQIFKRFKSPINIILWASLATVLHTFFVLAAVSMFKSAIPLIAIQSIVIFNMIPEVALAGFVVPLVGIELKKHINRDK